MNKSQNFYPTKTRVPETALILAAGVGSRLRPETDTPKPLSKVLGLTLAERVIRTLIEVGVERILVTLGHEMERVRSHFVDIARRHNVMVQFIRACGWERGNGASALAAKGYTGAAPFFLVMVDHIFDSRIAQALADVPPAPGQMCLAVDYDKNAIFDLDDVTRVKIDDGLIQEIGKLLDDWDAGDTGVMLCTSGLFEGLERARQRNKHGLSDGLMELAGKGQAKTVDVTGLAWIDVDTPESLRAAEHRLMSGRHGRCRLDGPMTGRLCQR